MRNKISNVLIVAALLLLMLKGANYLARRADPLPALPAPNGYEILLAEASKITLPGKDMADAKDEEIVKAAETNREPLARAREALRGPIAVPLKVAPKYVDEHAEEVKRLKRLGVAMGLQCRAEVLAGNTNAAAAYLLDMILLGQGMARGGIVSDAVSAHAVEAVGAASLGSLLSNLDQSFCKTAAQELERFEAKRETPKQMLINERNWAHASFGLVSRIGEMTTKAPGARKKQLLEYYEKTKARTQRLMIKLATRAYELETGKPLAATSDLAPRILQKIPEVQKSEG